MELRGVLLKDPAVIDGVGARSFEFTVEMKAPTAGGSGEIPDDSITEQKLSPEVRGKLNALPINGKSAYELAVEQGFVGTIDEWLESLKGKDANVATPMYFRDAGLTEPFELTDILPIESDGVEILGQLNGDLTTSYQLINATTGVVGFDGVSVELSPKNEFRATINIQSHSNVNNASLKLIVKYSGVAIGESVTNNVTLNNTGGIVGVSFDGVFAQLTETTEVLLSDVSCEIWIKGSEFASQAVSMEFVTAHNHVSMFTPKADSVSLTDKSVFVDGVPLGDVLKAMDGRTQDLEDLINTEIVETLNIIG